MAVSLHKCIFIATLAAVELNKERTVQAKRDVVTFASAVSKVSGGDGA